MSSERANSPAGTSGEGGGRRITANGIELHVVEAGPPEGPLVILLHGFPEFWWGWRFQIEPLAAAGFRVLVPDQRGYGGSDKPSGVAAYGLDTLAADVVGLADAVGRERFRLVGHDWGGLVAWWTATLYPERVEQLAILNAPHPSVAAPYARRHPSQALKSSYVGFFQLPWLPEALLRAGDFRAMRRALTGTSRPGTFGEADLARYRRAWAEPGALTAMLNWYRALRLRRDEPAGGASVRAPTLVLWGVRDQFLEPDLAKASVALCDEGRVQWFGRATHWVQHEEAQAVNEALIAFFGPTTPRT